MIEWIIAHWFDLAFLVIVLGIRRIEKKEFKDFERSMNNKLSLLEAQLLEMEQLQDYDGEDENVI